MVKSVLYLDIVNIGQYNDAIDPSIKKIELQNVTKLPNHIGDPSYFYNELEKKKLDVTFVKKDKIYFTPGCSVPRGKFKSYCETNDIKVIRDSSKANYVVYSKKSVDNLVTSNWDYTCDAVKLLEIFKNSKLVDIQDINTIELMLDQAEYKEKVLISYRTKNMLEKCILMIKNLGIGVDILTYKDSFDISTKKILKVVDRKSFELLFDPNTKIINQGIILSKISCDNVIDNNMYESIQKLFSSNQESDWTVAMEIMANSDLDKSALYNFLLFASYYKSRMAYAKSKNHVNFKSMVEYYEINRYINISLDVIIAFLKSKKVFNQKAYDILNPMYVKEIISQLGGDWKFKNIDFNVFDFKINTEIDEELDEPTNQIEEECLNLEA